MARSYAVYILRDAEEVVLYVGQSMTAANRLSQHREKPWWEDVAGIELRHCASKKEMCDLEYRLIRDLWPTYNLAHNQRVGTWCECTWPPQRMEWDIAGESWMLDGDTLVLGHWWCENCEDIDAADPPPEAERMRLPAILARRMREDEKRRERGALRRLKQAMAPRPTAKQQLSLVPSVEAP